MEKQVKIPSDVMVEIFCRLPARSVGRFRSVSKLYYRLLSQAFFIQQHLLHGGVSSSSVKLIVQLMEIINNASRWHEQSDRRKWFIYYPFSSYNRTLTFHGSELKYPSHPNPRNLSLSGSCNGLFCVEDGNNLVMLWNPTTREVYCLPELPDTMLEDTNSGQVTMFDYGLGYDLVNQDYKVVCVMSLNHGEGFLENLSTTKTYIYSHRSRCWKEIQAFPHCTTRYTIRGIMSLRYGDSKFVHNKIHWVPYCLQDGKCSQLIVSLDLATEAYGTVPQPNYHQRVPGVLLENDETNRVDVSVLRGKLCVSINYYEDENDFQVWMMQEYGVQQSWCHLFSISIKNLGLPVGLPVEGVKDIYVPLLLMESGEVLIKAIEYGTGGSSLYLYNPRTCRKITFHKGTIRDYCLSGHTYVESLVELK